jgi:transcriptional regulator with XRE-family HTH domain
MKRNIGESPTMTHNSVGTCLRFLRRKSGLSQRRLALIMGTVTAAQVSRHERSIAPPSLLAALGYQAIFRQPVSHIFPGLYSAVETVIEDRLREYAVKLTTSDAKGRAAVPIARQLEWFWERDNNAESSFL